MPHTSLTPPDGGTAVQVHFVKKLLVKESKVLAREACCFMSSDHDVADFDRLSFREFQQKWQNEYGKSGKGDGRYPEVRRRNSNKLFLGCTLRCTCGPCSHGKAKELRCDTYDFGDNHTVSDFPLEAQLISADSFKVLIHRFLWGGTTLAMILGTRDHQGGDYSIWGMIDAKTKQLSFHDRVLLREVSRTVLLKRPNRGSVSDGDDDESIPEDKFLEKRVKAPTTLEPHKRPRMLPTAAGNKMSASEETQGNAKTQAYSPVSDDEEDMTLSQLTRPRREAVAGGMPNATPVSTRASSPRRTSPKAQQPQPRDLQKALLDIRAYVNSRAGSDGSPVIFSNAGINRCMRGLGAAASRNDPYLFGNTRATIGEELAMVGLPLLPDI